MAHNAFYTLFRVRCSRFRVEVLGFRVCGTLPCTQTVDKKRPSREARSTVEALRQLFGDQPSPSTMQTWNAKRNSLYLSLVLLQFLLADSRLIGRAYAQLHLQIGTRSKPRGMHSLVSHPSPAIKLSPNIFTMVLAFFIDCNLLGGCKRLQLIHAVCINLEPSREHARHFSWR